MNNEHLPRIPYVKQEDPVSDWRDVPITSGRRSLKAELRSTTSPLGSRALVAEFYEKPDSMVTQEESFVFSYDPREPADAENIRNYLVKVRDLLSEWEVSDGQNNTDSSTKVLYKDLVNTISRLERSLDAQDKTLKKFNAARKNEEDEFAEQLEERREDIMADLESIGEQYQHFLPIDEFSEQENDINANPILMIEKQESADVLIAENDLLREYLSAMGFSEDQIEAKTSLLPEVEGRRRLVGKAHEWSLLNREGLLGEISGKVGRAAQYLDSIKAHVPEHMVGRYADLSHKLDTVVKPALDSYEQFFKGEEIDGDGWNTLKSVVKGFLEETSQFSTDLVGSQEDESENVPVNPVEEGFTERMDTEEPPRSRRRLVVEPRVPSEKITSFMREGDQIDTTTRRVFPGGSYPDKYDPGKSATILSGDLLEHFEKESRALEQYRSKVEKLRVSLYEDIFPKVKEELLSNEDKLDLKFLHTEFQNLQALLNEAEEENNVSGEMSPDTLVSLDTHYNQLLKGVTYYEDRIAAGDQLFGGEGTQEQRGNSDTEALAQEESIGVDIKSPTSIPQDDLPEHLLGSNDGIFEEISPAPGTTDSVSQESSENLRAAWLEAKKVHDEAQKEYTESLEGFYGSFWNRTRSSVGFKPDLPPEILEIKNRMFSATAAYNEASKQMTEERKRQRPVAKEVLERHKRLLAHSLVLRTFDDQLEIQKKAAESKYPKVREFLATHGKELRLAGAATIGYATGGIGTALWAGTRAVAGAYITGAATSLVGARQDKNVAAAREKFSEDYKTEAEKLLTLLNAKEALTQEELAQVYGKLDEIYQNVDDATQKRIRLVLATALGTGLLFGAGSGMLAESFTSDVPVTGVEDTSAGPATTESPAPGAANSETVPGDSQTGTSAEAATPIDVSEPTSPESTVSPEANPAYVAQWGDNLWDIMEGQTNAGELSYLDNVAEGDRQRLIALVTERVNQDATLRAELGFGATADNLLVGAEVDVERLNELAEEIAREKNLYTETPTVPTEGVPDSTGGEVAAAAAPDTDTPPTPDRPGDLAEVSNSQGVDSGTATENLSATTEAPTLSSQLLDVAGIGVGAGLIASSTKENITLSTKPLLMKSVVPQKNIEFARNYAGGYTKFEADFQKLFVERIQGPAPADSLLGRLFGGPPNSTDAFKFFGAYSVAEFDQLAKLDQTKLEQALAEEQIDMRDYLAWRDELAKWQEAGLVVNPNTRFSDVAEAAFINSLSQPRGT